MMATKSNKVFFKKFTWILNTVTGSHHTHHQDITLCYAKAWSLLIRLVLRKYCNEYYQYSRLNVLQWCIPKTHCASTLIRWVFWKCLLIGLSAENPNYGNHADYCLTSRIHLVKYVNIWTFTTYLLNLYFCGLVTEAPMRVRILLIGADMTEVTEDTY